MKDRPYLILFALVHHRTRAMYLTTTRAPWRLEWGLEADAELGLGDAPAFDLIVNREGIDVFDRHLIDLFVTDHEAALALALAIRANREMGVDVLNPDPGRPVAYGQRLFT